MTVLGVVKVSSLAIRWTRRAVQVEGYMGCNAFPPISVVRCVIKCKNAGGNPVGAFLFIQKMQTQNTVRVFL